MQEKHDLIIKSGLVVGSKSIKRVDIGVKDGKFSVLSPELKEEDAAEVIFSRRGNEGEEGTRKVHARDDQGLRSRGH